MVLPVYMDVLQAAKRLARQFKFRHFTVQLTPGKRPPEVVYDSATDRLTLFWGYSGGE